VVSSQALARRAAEAGITAAPSFPALLAAAQAGDGRALGMFADRARLVGAAAALLLDVLNPDLLVVTEAGATHLPGCLELLRGEARARSAISRDPGRSIVATSFGANPLPVAGGIVILDEVYASPLRRRAMSRAS
jgi:predicted NBD/HSP70 family sugar kinase